MAHAIETDPLVGAVLEGRFRVEKILGRGGMGNVYAAEELRLRRRCALKVLQPEIAKERANVDRFLREAQTIAQLSHENIVDIYSFGEDTDGAVFFTMELLEGEDLENRLKDFKRRPTTWREVCGWGIQVARAVGAVHAAGLIHRDLKPANVFLTRRRDGSELVKLLDFGIVRAEDGPDLTRTGAVFGTPHYMSPEQLRQMPMDRRSDVYSFGVLLFKALTGKIPFRGEPIQVALMHVQTPPPSLIATAPELEIPQALEDLVLRAMSKDPAERFQTMEEVEDALREILGEVDPAALASGSLSSLTSSMSGQSRRASMILRVPESSSMSVHDLTVEAERKPRPRWLVPAIGGGALALVAIVAMIASGGEAPPAQEAEAPRVIAAEVPPAPPSPPAQEAEAPAAGEAAEDDADEPQGGRRKASRAGASRPADPHKQLASKAQACRKRHDALGGAKITIDYAVGSDGKVTRSVPAQDTALGHCLAGAVRQVQFSPKLALGQKVAL